MQSIETLIQKPEFIGRKLQYEGKVYVVKHADNYSYTDPVDGSKAAKQVHFPQIINTNFQLLFVELFKIRHICFFSFSFFPT